MRRTVRSWSRYVPSSLLMCSLVVLFAATPKTPPAKPAVSKVPKITVNKTEAGSKPVVGELVEATPAGVTLKPVTAAGEGGPVTIAWAQVKTVSNGLTRQKVLDEWKTTHADRLCQDCEGEGTTKCNVCHGTGVDPAQAKPCDKCKGTGDLGKCPKCTDGKVPCPATCIKAEMFLNQKPDADGKRWKYYPDGHGWSDHHVGDLVVKEGREYVNRGKCPTCLGTSKVICPTCHGTAKRECPACHGAGVLGPACTAGCKAGRVECKTCRGTGLKPENGDRSAAAASETPATPPGGAAADKP